MNKLLTRKWVQHLVKDDPDVFFLRRTRFSCRLGHRYNFWVILAWWNNNWLIRGKKYISLLDFISIGL